jgi:hypothetical protein
MIWTRIGDLSEYESFGDDLEAVAGRLCELQVGGPRSWRPGGLETAHYKGLNYVSLYHGDAEANFIRDLSASERRALADRLTRLQLGADHYEN